MKTSLFVFLCLTCLGQVKGYAIGAGGGSARLSQAGSTDVKLLLQTPSVAQEVLRVQDVTSGGEALARSAALNVLTSAEAGAGAAVGAGAGAGAGGAVLLSGLGGVSTGFGGGGVSFENDGDFDDDLFDDRFDDDRFEFDDDWFDFDDIFDDDDSFEFGDFGFGTSAGQVSGGVDAGAGGAGAGFDWITLLGDAVSGGGDLTALEAALCDAGFNLDTGLDLSSLGVGSSSEEVGLTSSGGSLGTLGVGTGAGIDAGSLLSLLGAGGDALFPQGSVSVGVSGPTAGRVSSSFLSRLLPAATAPSTVSLDLQSLLPSAPRTVSLRGTDLGISSTFPGVQQTVSTTASRPLPSVSGAFLERLGLGGTTTVDVSIVLRRLGLQSIRVPSYYYRIIVRIVTRIIYGQATSSDIRYLLKIISYFRSSATTGTSGQTTTSGQATTSGQLTSGQVISGPAVSGQAPSSSTRITLRTLLQQPTLLKSILTRLALRSGVTTGTTGTSGTTVGGTVTGTSGGTTTTTGTTSSGRSFRLLLEALKAILRRLKIVEAARSTQTSTGAGLTGGATVDLGTSVGVSTGGSVSQGQTTSGVSTGSKSSSEDDDSNRDVIRQLSSLLLSSGASGILGKGVDNGFDNGFNGNGFDGNGINGNGFDNGFNGNGFDNGFNGNGFDNGFNGNGFDNGFNGNGFDNGFNGVDNGGFKILTSSGTAGVTSGTSLGSSLASLLGSTSGTGTSSVNLADLIRKLSISAPSLTSGSTTTTTGTRLSLTDLYALIRKLGLSISSSGSLGGSSSITSGSTGTIGGSLSGTSSGSLGTLTLHPGVPSKAAVYP